MALHLTRKFNAVIVPKRSTDSIKAMSRGHRSSLVVRSDPVEPDVEDDPLPVLHDGQRLPRPDPGFFLEPH